MDNHDACRNNPAVRELRELAGDGLRQLAIQFVKRGRIVGVEFDELANYAYVSLSRTAPKYDPRRHKCNARTYVVNAAKWAFKEYLRSEAGHSKHSQIVRARKNLSAITRDNRAEFSALASQLVVDSDATRRLSDADEIRHLIACIPHRAGKLYIRLWLDGFNQFEIARTIGVSFSMASLILKDALGCLCALRFGKPKPEGLRLLMIRPDDSTFVRVPVKQLNGGSFASKILTTHGYSQ
jgi:RNA polymerase sigma factor (sigma-70 family)